MTNRGWLLLPAKAWCCAVVVVASCGNTDTPSAGQTEKVTPSQRAELKRVGTFKARSEQMRFFAALVVVQCYTPIKQAGDKPYTPRLAPPNVKTFEDGKVVGYSGHPAKPGCIVQLSNVDLAEFDEFRQRVHLSERYQEVFKRESGQRKDYAYRPDSTLLPHGVTIEVDEGTKEVTYIMVRTEDGSDMSFVQRLKEGVR